jgi:hypothetical protein
MSEPLELDHLLYATPDVDATVAELEGRFGVEFRAGGRHPGWGTRNAILPLGDRTYLEVIGPDEAQPETEGRRILDVDRLGRPRLAWWAVRPLRMALTCGTFETAGFVTGPVIQGERRQGDGSRLVWQITDPRVRLLDGLLPLVIDWEGASHPGAEGSGVTLTEFRLRHPDHATLSPTFVALGLPPVHAGTAPELAAVFDTPNGAVTLS